MVALMMRWLSLQNICIKYVCKYEVSIKTSKHLISWGDIRAAMDPTVVLGKIGVQTMEFTAGWEHFKYLYQEHFGKDVGVSRTTFTL